MIESSSPIQVLNTSETMDNSGKRYGLPALEDCNENEDEAVGDNDG